MKTLNASLLCPGGNSSSRFDSARALAFSLAESDSELLEPEIVAWRERMQTDDRKRIYRARTGLCEQHAATLLS